MIQISSLKLKDLGRWVARLVLLVPFLAIGASLNLKSGATFDFTITDGTAPYRTSGRYRFLVLDAGTSYRTFNIRNTIDSTGTMTYSHVDEDTDAIDFTDSIDGAGFEQLLEFATVNQGHFHLSNTRFSAAQDGSFTVYEGYAPQILNRKLLTLTVSYGTAPFATSGTQRFIAISSAGYVLENKPGVTNSFGTFSYARLNRSSGQIFFNDSVRSTGFNLLTFANDHSGVFVVRGDGGGYQTGTFTLTTFVPLSITFPSSDRNVLIGGSVTLSPVVAGTGPIFYQWQKNGFPITGATNRQYTIPFAQLSDQGDYRLVARNAGGTVTSLSTSITPVCNYILTPKLASFDEEGGTSDVEITGTSPDCSWSVENDNSWITITSESSGTGVGAITYSVEPNDTDFARVGSLTIGNQMLVVSQAARRAPPSLVGKTILLQPLTEGGNAVRFVVTPATLYEVGKATNGVSSFNRGAYVYTRGEGDEVFMNYADSDQPRSLTLDFSAHRSGSYAWRTDSEVISEGTFVLLDSGPDFNFDARTDFLFQNANRQASYWLMRGTNYLGGGLLRNGTPSNPGWHAMAAADFNGDGRTDVLFQHDTGAMAVWYMDSARYIGAAQINKGIGPAAGWRVVDVMDFDHDGSLDIIFQHTSRRLMVWYLNGVSFIQSQLLCDGKSPPVGWQAVGLADMNQDGQPDILWRHADRRVMVWNLAGNAFINSVSIPPPVTGWKVIGISDFNEDGNSDLILRHDDGRLSWWLMQGEVHASTSVLRKGARVSPAWTFVVPK